MPDWDEDSPQLRGNIDRVQHRLELEAVQRVKPTLKLVKSWHVDTPAAQDEPLTLSVTLSPA